MTWLKPDVDGREIHGGWQYENLTCDLDGVVHCRAHEDAGNVQINSMSLSVPAP